MENGLMQIIKQLIKKEKNNNASQANHRAWKNPPSRKIQRYVEKHYKDPRAALKLRPGAMYSIRIEETPMPDTQKKKSGRPRTKTNKWGKGTHPSSDDELIGFSFHEITRDIDREIKKKLDESFQEMLLRKIDESGMSDVECYNRAHIDRRMFSKMRCDRQYRPSKQTALAFAIALRLNLKDTGELIGKAGYFMSYSNKSDVIVRYFIKHKCFDLDKINEVLYYYDQSLLGSW